MRLNVRHAPVVHKEARHEPSILEETRFQELRGIDPALNCRIEVQDSRFVVSFAATFFTDEGYFCLTYCKGCRTQGRSQNHIHWGQTALSRLILSQP